MSQPICIFFVYNNGLIALQAVPYMMFAEIALKFFNRIGALHQNHKFYFHSKEIKLDSYKSLEELNIINDSRIHVVEIRGVTGPGTMPNNDNSPITISFRNKESIIDMQTHPSETFDNIIKKFNVMSLVGVEKLRFYFNSLEITDYNETLREKFICDKSIIDVKISFNKKIEEEKKGLIKQLDKEKEKNKELLDENNKLRQKLEIFNNENKKMKKLLEKKDEQSEYSIESINPGEKILAVNFVSMGRSDIGHYNLICKNVDLFVSLEKRLYKDFPKFKDFNTYFEVNGHSIKRFKTMDENKIKNNDIINIFCDE